ncbi:MAG: hypothetical protein WEC73_00720 [Chthoniobacterales bacterium]
MRFIRHTVIFAALLAAVPPVAAQQEIKAPFGMQWGESPERIRQVVTNAKAKVIEERTSGKREVMVVEGIVQEGLKRTLFYFSEGGLGEVELQYDREGWDETRVNSWVSTIKQQADRKYGRSRLYADERGDEDGVKHTLRGWMWVQNFVSLRLVHYSAEKDGQRMRRVSLHYCAE